MTTQTDNPVHPEAWADSILSAHPDFMWNKDRSKIRCNGPECREVMDSPSVDEAAGQIVFSQHKASLFLRGPTHETAPVAEEPVAPAPAPDVVPATPEEATPEAEEPATEPPAKPVKSASVPRRDLKEIAANLEGLKEGDLVVAEFKTPRYGLFKIEGVVVRMSVDKKALVLGSWTVSIAGKPGKQLHSLEVLAKKGSHDQVIEPRKEGDTDDVGTS